MTLMLGPGRTIETEALVVKRLPYADADWIVTLFTSKLGKVTALAARARHSKHRFAGGLEAFHNLTVQLRSTRSDELLQLIDGSITRARHGLATQLLPMQTAGRALNCAPRVSTQNGGATSLESRARLVERNRRKSAQGST